MSFSSSKEASSNSSGSFSSSKGVSSNSSGSSSYDPMESVQSDDDTEVYVDSLYNATNNIDDPIDGDEEDAFSDDAYPKVQSDDNTEVHLGSLDNDTNNIGDPVEVDEEDPFSDVDYSKGSMNPPICDTYVSPGKTTYWIPRYEQDKKPFVGRRFATLAEAIKCYEDYAKAVGFDTRNSTMHCATDGSGTVLRKYMLCTRQGFCDESTSTGKRTRYTKRVGCNAVCRFKFVGNNGYVVYEFDERHTHTLLYDTARQFMKCNRKLDMGHKKWIMSCARAGLGGTNVHKVVKEIVGGYENVGGLASDFNNFKRDMMAYICSSDAQMVIDKLHQKKEICSGFFFDYALNGKQQLTRIFWADPTSRMNYAAFGDLVAFDPTYKTNKYSLIFAPFTGIDNHEKSVTFAAGLLFKEDVESYIWLFDCFKRSMKNDPSLIVTDQDPSMKNAIARMFPNTRHRFCMWHVTSKFPEKISPSTCDYSELMGTLCKLVWNEHIDPPEFEQQWKAFIIKFKLQDHDWLEQMYGLRQFWIPAYFRKVVMASRLRTTSISESQNCFFKRFCGRKLTLVELLMNFDSALDRQRHEHHRLSVTSQTGTARLKTPLKIEQHVSDAYTKVVFKEIQEEIYQYGFKCHVTATSEDDLHRFFTVKDDKATNIQVQHRSTDGYTSCTCKLFERRGIICRHIFLIFNYMSIDTIPDCMLLNRWRQDPYLRVIFDDELLQEATNIDKKKSLVNELWSTIYSCVGIVEDDNEHLRYLLHTLQEKRKSYMSHGGCQSRDVSETARIVESYVGIPVPDHINIHPPDHAKTKGSGKRLRGGKEKSIEESQKKQRQCKICKKYGHNSRTCKSFL